VPRKCASSTPETPLKKALRVKAIQRWRTISTLAFISPVLTGAAMEGRLPRGFSVKRLTELPMLWSEQWSVLGLQEPIQAQAEIG
jgi:hypothetical protein